MSTVVQPCARCGTRWPVSGSPQQWCPRCRGVLLSPARLDAPPERRNYRWVARRPRGLPRQGRPIRRVTTPTPHYLAIPRWGLRDRPVESSPEPVSPVRALAARVNGLLQAVAVIFGVAAAGELLRYAILLYNRGRLVSPLVLFFSDLWVTAAGSIAPIVALVAAVGVVGWLVAARRCAYRRIGRSDPRSVRLLALGCLLPVANVLWAGVFASELAQIDGDPRKVLAVRRWWAAFAFGSVCVVAGLWWRRATTLQAQADGVIFAAFTDGVAAGVAILTLWTMLLLEGRDLSGGVRRPHRWVMATGPAIPVIAPIEPIGSICCDHTDAVTAPEDSRGCRAESAVEPQEVR